MLKLTLDETQYTKQNAFLYYDWMEHMETR